MNAQFLRKDLKWIQDFAFLKWASEASFKTKFCLQNWASFGNSQLLNVPTLANQNTTKIQKEEFQTL